MNLGLGSNGCASHAGRLGLARWGGVLGVGLGLWLVGATEAAATFEAQGRVAAIDPARDAVTLEHGGIPGLLPAGRSEFSIAGAGLLGGVAPGDRVRFTLTAADESHGLLTVTSLTPETAGGRWRDWLVASVVAGLALGVITTGTVTGVLLWRSLRALHRRVIALDHELGMLRRDVMDTQDGVRQIARALEDAATTFRVGYARELRRRLGSAAVPASSRDGAASGPDGALVVVQRGRGELYRAVENGAVGTGCTAMWDRRRGDRRIAISSPVGHERRRGERRASPPETWTRLGFHILPGSHAEAPRGLRPVGSAGGERGSAR